MRKDDLPNKKPLWEILRELTPLIIAIFVTGGGTLLTNQYNNRQLQLKQVETLERFSPLLESKDEFKRAFAYEAFTVLGYGDMALRLIAMRDDPAGKHVLRVLEKSGSGSAQAEAKAALQKLPSRVYIHTASAKQNALVDPLRTALQANSEFIFTVADQVQNVSGMAGLPKHTNVRYFNEADKGIADEVVQIVKTTKIDANAYAIRIGGYNVRPGGIEVWFGTETRPPATASR